MTGPFIFRFQHKDRFYVYDVNTSAVVEVDRCLYELIEHVQVSESKSGFAAQLTDGAAALVSQFSQASIDAALGCVADARRSMGLFSDRHPAQVAFPFNRQEMDLVLHNVLRHVILNVTEQCNLRCQYCAFSGAYPLARTHSNRNMTLGVARKAVDLLIRNSSYTAGQTSERLTIGFYGGEPLLQFPLIRAVVDYARASCTCGCDRLLFAMTTNLTAASTDALHFLADNDFSLLVSLDGPAAVHDRYRVTSRGAGSFRPVLDNLELLKASHPDYYDKSVSFSVVLAPPYEFDAIREFFDTCDLVRNHRIGVSFVDEDNTTFFEDPARSRSDAWRRLGDLRSDYLADVLARRPNPGGCLAEFLGSSLRDVVNRPNYRLPQVLYPSGCCLPGAHRTFVATDGTLYICERNGGTAPIGDVDSGFDLEALEKVMLKYAALAADRCPRCWAVRFCRLCYRSALRGAEFSVDQQESHCAAVRRGTLADLKLYCDAQQSGELKLTELFPPVPVMPTGLDLAIQFMKRRGECVTPAGSAG